MKLTFGPLLQRLAVVSFMAMTARGENTPDAAFPPDLVTTTPSDVYPQVTCTGDNPAVVSDVLQMAVDTRETFGPLLKLGRAWRYPVHILVVSAGLPQARQVKEERTSVLADGHTLKIEAAFPADDPNPREFVQRQFVTALLWEKYFKPDTSFTAATRLDVVPLWLVEGLREWLNDDPEHNREEVVKRAALAQRAPTLAEVTGWQELSDDRLLGLWQRAFCYYLVDSLLLKNKQVQNERRADFEQWIDSIAGTNPSSSEFLFPTEMGWQRELLQASGRSRDLFYTWDESAAELAAADTIVLPHGKKTYNDRICTIETVSTFPRDKELDKAVRNKVLELTELELRAHPSWRPVISLYRLGLTALTSDKDPTHAAAYFHQANQQRAHEIDLHQKLVDYTNWYEVTNSPVESSHFQAYFRTASELDKTDADPAHPNPLRAGLLKVEAEF